MRWVRSAYWGVLVTTAAMVVACGCKSQSHPQPGTSAHVSVNDIGFVLEVHGDWLLEGGAETPIQAGDSLPAGGVVSRAASSVADDVLLISLCTGEVQAITSSELKDNRYQLPPRVDSDRIKRVWSLASKRYHGELISAQSRGGEGDSKLRDTAVRVTTGELQLAPAFEGMPAGRYRLRLEPVQGLTATDASAVIPLDSYEWSPSAPQSLKVEQVPRGAYELYALKDGAANAELSALVLICEHDEYDQIVKDVHSANDLVATWGTSTSNGVKRRFIQAALAGLATDKLLPKSSK